MRALLSACLLLTLAGCGSPDPLTIKGDLVLEDTDIDWGLDGEGVGNECRGMGGYDDITQGATVVVRDSKGDRVGVGHLDAGHGVDANLGVEAAYCRFAFEVTGVESDSKLFSVEITHRGEITFKRAEAGAVSVTLG